MEEELITGVLHNRKENLCYSTCSKYLVYSIESQFVGFRVQASMVESFDTGKSQWWSTIYKQIIRLVRTCQNCTLWKIVIEDISYLVKQFSSCTCTPQSFMVDRSGFSYRNDLNWKCYPISNPFIKKQRPWLKKWRKEVKEILFQKGLSK